MSPADKNPADARDDPAGPVRLSTIFWRGRWFIVIALFCSLSFAVLATYRAEKVYEANALLRIDRAIDPASVGDPYNSEQASQSLAGTYAVTIGSRSFLARIASTLPGNPSAASLEGDVVATAIKDTSLIALTARGPSPEAARELATTVSDGFIAAVREDAQARSEAQARDLQEEIAAVDAQITRASESGSGSVDALQGAREDLVSQLGLVLGTGAGAGAVAVAPASASSSPVAPRPLINIAAGLVFGVILGVSLAGLADALRRRRARRAAAPDTTVPVLGSVSVPPLAKELSSADRAAFDAIASTVWQRASGRGETIVGVVSEPDLADRATVTRELARSARRQGAGVLLVDGAFEGRLLSASLEHETSEGLGDLLVRRRRRYPVVETTRGLAFLPAGRSPATGGASLVPNLRRVLSEVAAGYEMVLVDAPAEPPHGMLVARAVEAVVLVTPAGAGPEGARALADALADQTQARLVGIVEVSRRGTEIVPANGGAAQTTVRS